MDKKLWVSVDRIYRQVLVWDAKPNPCPGGYFSVATRGNPKYTLLSLMIDRVVCDCPEGECREIDGDALTFNSDGKLVIPTVKPRAVEDVKEEIIKVLGEWVDEPGEPASSHGRRMTVLIHELRALQPKAWK